MHGLTVVVVSLLDKDTRGEWPSCLQGLALGGRVMRIEGNGSMRIVNRGVSTYSRMKTVSSSACAHTDCRASVVPGNAARRTMIATATLVLITLLLYAPATTFSFVSLDDGLHLFRDPYMQHPSAATVARFWQAPYANLYIPVAYSCWTAIRYAERYFFHSSSFHPELYHAVNISLHLLNVILLFRILLLLGNMPYGALAGALLFAVHPVQTESVAWVSEMRGLVAASFSFFAIYIALKSTTLRAQQTPTYSRTASIAGQAVAMASFTLALLAKPTVVVLPVMYAALCLFYESKTVRKRILSTAVLWLCLSLPIAVATRIAQPSLAGMQVTPLALRPLVMLDCYGFYMKKLLLPIDCTIDYGRRPDTLLTMPTEYIGTVLLALAVASAVLVFRKKYPVLLPGVLIFIAGILPTSGIVPFCFQEYSTVADRYLYLPLMGIAILVAAIPVPRLSRGVRAVMCLLALLLFLLSFSLVRTWRNDGTLYRHALDINPRSVIGANNLASLYKRNGNLEMAADLFCRALITAPQSPFPYAGLAGIRERQCKISQAITLMNCAIERAPLNPQYYEHRAILHKKNGDIAKTGIDLMRAFELRHGSDSADVDDQ